MERRKAPCLILEGGGVKCAYQYGIIRALYERGALPEFGGIAGTSFGALNSALYISGGVERMGSLWESLSASKMFNEPMLDRIVDRIYSKRNPFDMQTVLFLLSQWSSPSQKHNEISELYRKAVIVNVDEEAIRSSPLDFGLVTAEIPLLSKLLDMSARKLLNGLVSEHSFHGALGFNPREMTKIDIPEGRLAEFVAASANYIAFTPICIDGVHYTDGGLYDNMPVRMMEKLGYTRFLCIRTNMGEPKKRWSDSAEVTYISPTEEMGHCALFSKDKINDLISLGERDAADYLEKHALSL